MVGMDQFGSLIKSRRENLALRIEDVADALSRPSSFVWRMESGKNANPPDPTTVEVLAKVLKLSPEAMLEALGYLQLSTTHDEPDEAKSHVHAIVDQYEWTQEEANVIAEQIISFRNFTSRTAK